MRLAILALCVLIAGCTDGLPTKVIQQPFLPGRPLFVPGEVIVSTTAEITDQRFAAFIDSLGLRIIERNYDAVFFWIEVSPDSVSQALIRLRQSFPLFSAVNALDYPYDDGNPEKKYIYASYKWGKDASDPDSGRMLLETLGLVLKRIVIIPRAPEISALLGVTPGEERRWIATLRSFPFVRYAELNYYAYLDH